MTRRSVEPRPLAPAVSLVSRETADSAAIEAIARVCFEEDSGFSLADELVRPWSRIWVANVEGAVAGFIVAWHVADELHVLNVGTMPALRRRGVATALMAAALAYASAEHVRIVLLEVRRSNRAAIRLYRGLGFTALGVRPGYYANNGEDAIEMVLVLDPVTGRVVPQRDEIRIDA